MSNITSSNRDIKALSAVAQTACNLFMSKCKEAGLNVLITETTRSQERQNYLYCQGRTVSQCVAKGIPKDFATQHCNPSAKQVTWTLSSNHKTGYAWDICKNIKGQEYSDNSFFDKAGAIAKELGIEWGGTWKEKDTPHFQVTSSWKAPTNVSSSDSNIAKIKVVINGVEKEVSAINVNGNNFLKLQDLRDDKIFIGYDAEKKMPTITCK